ncbi:2-phosphosulfolactate phosphatase [Thermanaerothrix sp. 4228-RoL]|uniref:Probable 2-phosphosulfolactate phosphatase n=2 Tax=Thermanaerothrix TaxID=1077886 RepID=A0ABU3NMS5_9CHLR|nr:2-phosphosulfolactate phosphatase [Thermanaerothrix sp. 4228-RoL]MDT8898144.1 2-phosphosulfolactate phosphatase [Thermanaerothrix sp. 4228-RoL]
MTSPSFVFQRANLETCAQAADIVVVIDVLRAFSTAAYAFAAGAERILLVSTVDEALALKQRLPHALIVGEVNGFSVPGFDFCNSPSQIVGQDLRGRTLIQRTTAGTQGVVRAQRARHILATAFCTARATAMYLHRFSGHTITFVITGQRAEGGGEEDAVCADYIEALLRGENPSPGSFIQRVRESSTARKFLALGSPDFPPSDLDYCTAVDRFDFAMVVNREGDLFVLRAVAPLTQV